MGFFQQLLQKETFNPGPLGIVINPFYIARRGLYKEMSRVGTQLSGRLLDVGCGTKPYKQLFQVNEYIGLEIDTTYNREKKDIDVFYDGTVFPFEDNSFDSLLCNQVLEHVFNPEEFLQQINRVLKVGGKGIITVPFAWDEHEQPYDYARYSSFGLKSLLEKNGFEVIELRKSVADLRVLTVLMNGYLYKKTVKYRFLRIFATILLMFPNNVIGSIIGLIMPRNEDLYLDNIVLFKKVKATK
ncbi:methyltransferase family protein [Chitinophaga dinghuensis]|uniref:Methyltransferase family protein n=1 Tax=Chitinophaga dinghuensis TaxID=1539050 RepID=A0A327VHY1_9BACT|nr:class I SAM-dependent methyltransferase [Chitinophaga dinghuensis]RAJ73484.1 methyltransferase family protein [Chitinophaga dinghuensis]